MDDDTGRNDAPTRRRTQGDPAIFVLQRELSEVHLLLDNVSANPTTTVTERSDIKRPEILKDDWIARVCDINWPPELDADKARDAAMLIHAKDYLNRLAHPASGSTIAFTHLVTQASEERRRRAAEVDAAGGSTEQTAIVQTRCSLAENAYPDLLAKAAKFRKAMLLMSLGLLAALVLTCMMSWYVAYGNAVLAEYQTAQTALDRAATEVAQSGAVPAQPTIASSGERGTGGAPLSAAAICSQPAGASTATVTTACFAHAEAAAALDRVKRRIARRECWTCDNAADPEVVANAPAVASAWANILGSAVLPFLYGLLGAGAAIIRSLSRKIRASLLSPRDLMLSVQQLALGAVVGACIGLFIAAPGGDATGEGLLGPVTLSASAVSFVAGFGVDAVFQGLEALIGRIFNLSSPAPATNRGDGLPHN